MIAALLLLRSAKELWMFYLFAVLFGLSWGGGAALHSPITAELFGLRSHGAILGIVVFAGAIEILRPVAVGQQPVVPDALEAIGQDVEQEPEQKLERLQARLLPLAAVTVVLEASSRR